MIFDAEWRRQFHQHVLPRLAVAHPDLSRMAAKLRDTTVSVWTESPTDPEAITTDEHYSLEGWRVHWRGEFQQLNQWRSANGTKLQGYDPQALTALDGYLASLPFIGTAFNDVIAKYKNAQGRVIQTPITQADRNTLATAIEAELQ